MSDRPAGPEPPGRGTGAPRRFLPRFGRYLAERFPLPAFVPLITMFTFSSAAYSRMARGAGGFIPWPLLAVGALTSLGFFFTLRVLDEHKDADVDRRFRPELPVPRGLVSLRELRLDRKSTRLNSSHSRASRMPSSA